VFSVRTAILLSVIPGLLGADDEIHPSRPTLYATRLCS
jgi:hypothetical protein